MLPDHGAADVPGRSARTSRAWLFRGVVTSTSMHKVLIVHEDEIATLVGRGELDAFAAPELERAFGELASVPHLLVDLSGVSFMDSTALGCVVRAARACEARRARLKIVLPTGAARRIFEITTLDRVLPVAESKRSALAELSA